MTPPMLLMPDPPPKPPKKSQLSGPAAQLFSDGLLARVTDVYAEGDLLVLTTPTYRVQYRRRLEGFLVVVDADVGEKGGGDIAPTTRWVAILRGLDAVPEVQSFWGAALRQRHLLREAAREAEQAQALKLLQDVLYSPPPGAGQ